MSADEYIAPVAEWLESYRSKSGRITTNILNCGARLARTVRDSGLPLAESDVFADSQLKGLSGAFMANLLRDHGEERTYTAEGGRTSRGTLPAARGLLMILNAQSQDSERALSDEESRAVGSALEEFFVRAIRLEYFDKERLVVDLAYDAPASSAIGVILDAARSRIDASLGIVAQHLVGAKLELRFPDEPIGRDSGTTADKQTGRSGDFRVGTTAFHVTVAPMEKLGDRCRQNVADGLRPIILTPLNRVAGAAQMMEIQGLSSRVGVQAIESFVGTNVEEIAVYDSDGIRKTLAALVRRYNERIEAVESDKSLRIKEPDWVQRALNS